MRNVFLLTVLLAAVVGFSAWAQELPADPKVLDTITALNEEVLGLVSQGRFQEALVPAREAFELYTTVAGQDSPELALALNNLAWLYAAAGKPAEALPLYERALSIVEWKAGPSHPDVAVILNAMGRVLDSLGEPRRAMESLERALAIRETHLGKRDALVAETLNDLGWVQDNLMQHAKAADSWQRALAIWDAGAEVDPQIRATVVNNLGYALAESGRLEEAEAAYRRALDEQAMLNGPRHPESINVMNNLAGVLADLGKWDEAGELYGTGREYLDEAGLAQSELAAAMINNQAELLSARARYGEAEKLIREGLSLREELFGRNSAEYGLGLSNLAALHGSMGQHDLARPEFEEALDILSTALGSEHPLVAGCLSALGATLNALGDYAQSEIVLRRSMDLHTRIYGLGHPATIAPMNNLALCHLGRGEKEEARIVLELARKGLEEAGREASLDHAHVLSSLAGVLLEMDRAGEALDINTRALEIRTAKLGPEHPETAACLHNQAAMLDRLGRSREALDTFVQALGLMEAALGPDHPNVAHVYNNIGRLQARLGDTEAALASLARGQEGMNASLDDILAMSSERERLAYLSVLQESLHVYVSLALASGGVEDQERAWGAWLRRKGIGLEVGELQRAVLASDMTGEVEEVATELARVRAEMAAITLAPPDDLDREDWRKAREDLAGRRESLEAELSRRSGPFADMGRGRHATPESVVNSLPGDSVIFDIMRLTPYEFSSVDTARTWQPPRYIAFVAMQRSQDEGHAFRIVDLGEAASLDNGIRVLRRAITDQADEEARAEQLHAMLFQPLMEALRDMDEQAAREVDTFFVSPDGGMHLLPWEAMKRPSGHWLVEDYSFAYLAAARDIVGFGLGRQPMAADLGAPGPPVLMGDPDYGQPGSTDSPDPVFPSLPGTREEVEAVASIMERAGRQLGQAQVFLGEDADEEHLFAISRPRMLHLATHGFFLSKDQAARLHPGERAFLLVTEGPPGHEGNEVAEALFRSGLALSGANSGFGGGMEPGSDGLVTAEEMLGLRLWGTELVVLSACKTGLGEALDGEGVFGLRRAIALSGARSLIMSLWSVPDQETRELMESFYAFHLIRGFDRAQSLRQAMLAQLDVVRERYNAEHPYYWAPFVFLGEP